jgi:ethanolamine ammonia-lyase small subunit
MMNIQEIVEKVIKELEKRNKHENEENLSEFLTKKMQSKEDISNISREFIYKKENRIGVENPKNREVIERAQSITPARIGIGRTGTRMKTKFYLDFLIDHAAAQDAVFKDVSESFLKKLNLPILHSKAKTMDEYLMNLELGRKLSDESVEWAKKNLSKNVQVQIIISDGLSSTGIEANIPDLLPALIQGIKAKNIIVGDPIFIKRSRVWIQDEIASITNCDVAISLIGERPGLATAKSISAYLIYRPNENTVEADRTVISNIHEGGIPPVEAGAYLADLLEDVLKYKASGVTLAKLRES